MTSAGSSSMTGLCFLGFMSRARMFACMGIFIILGTPDTAQGQTRIRRLGERIREGVQQRLPNAPLAPAPAQGTPSSAAATRGLGLRRPDVANPNAANSQPSVGQAAATQSPRSAIARSNYNSPSRSPSSNGNIAPAFNKTENRAIAESGQSILYADQSAAASKARLGVTVETPPAAQPSRSNRPSRGAVVVGVAERSGAEAAGFQIGDLIVAVDGRVVDDVADFVSRLSNKQPGDQVEIRYVRNQQLEAATAIMAGPDGRLDDEMYARQFALLEPSANAADETGAKATRPSDSATSGAVGGLGRILGGLMGSQRTQGKPFVLKDERANREAVVDEVNESEEANESEELPAPLDPEAFEPLIVEEAKAKANSERVKTDYDTLEAPADVEAAQEESLPPPVQ